MLLNEVAPAAVNPVPLRELAAHLRIATGFTDDGSEDALLELYLRNATAVIERRTGKALVSRGFLLKVARWNRRGHVVLPVGPVETVDRVDLIRPGSTVVLAQEDWSLEPGTCRQRLTGPGGGALRALPHGAVAEIGFSAGYGPGWNDVPDDLRQAVLQTAAHFYENRSGEGAGDGAGDGGLPHGVQPIVDQHRPVRL